MNESGDQEQLLPEELDILRRLTNFPIHIGAMTVVSNIYRAGQRMRLKMEREVLSQYGLSWTGFALLYNVWIWQSMEARELAKSMGVTVATVSSISNTLEAKSLIERRVNQRDRRLVEISLTEQGRVVIEELYPLFNQREAEIVEGMNENEQQMLAHLLRKVIKNME
ncbi:MarR family winged helix-turn-helix transcriptional regulator [Brevibacillus fluminis]|uniref:MarR family winged helix-turn-helix transcriptional regulator n=1 Tax=Brevibacillus fluminis TaxID=511487 RepID=UPI003F8A0CB2